MNRCEAQLAGNSQPAWAVCYVCSGGGVYRRLRHGRQNTPFQSTYPLYPVCSHALSDGTLFSIAYSSAAL